MRYAWVKEHKEEFAITITCKVLEVSRSGYYRWLNHKPSAQKIKRDKVAVAARKYHAESGGIYGYRKVLEDIQEYEPELDCAPETIRLIMKSEHLFSCAKRKLSPHNLSEDCFYQYAENTLDRDFTATAPNEKWAADITYIKTYAGWLYLPSVMDLFSRKIVGWSMSDSIDAELVCNALESALVSRSPEHEVLHHSDRGPQYTSSKFHKLLDKNNIQCRMNTRCKPWNNACQESFFGKLKTEWVRGRVYRTHEEARQDIFKYIEIFYNRKRRHASLGYISPEEFERRAAEKAA